MLTMINFRHCLKFCVYPDSETTPRSIEKGSLAQLRVSVKGTGQSTWAFVPFLLLNVPPLCIKQAILALTALRDASGQTAFPGSKEYVFELGSLPGQVIFFKS